MNAGFPSWLDPRPWLSDPGIGNEGKVKAAIFAETPGEKEFVRLISPTGGNFLELMARRATDLTRRHFGKTISLFVPLYLSNYCSSGCIYCGFASDRRQPRRRLEGREMMEEMRALKEKGFEDVLLLTGERGKKAGFDYLLEAVAVAAGRFHKVSVEAFAMSVEEYARLAGAGCTGVTIYQETYDPDLYDTLHRWGRKRDYAFRLDAPARALSAGIRTVGLGVLLGLGNPILDLICLFRHAKYLMKQFWKSGITVSFPRLRPQTGGYQPEHPVSERFLAQAIFAFKICMPEVPLVLSTREAPEFRDGMAGMGISRMSVASRTTVGGYTEIGSTSRGQFEVADGRDVESFCAMLKKKGLQPVFKDWDRAFQAIP
jgi:2-iminoacetate synthase